LKILFLGDIVGRDGRDEVISKVSELREKYKLEAVIVNGENSVNGFGISPQVCNDFFAAGVDCITTGNHIWDQRAIISYIDGEKRLLRPINFPENTPGNGSYIIETSKGNKILVVNAMARLFMNALDDPFAAMKKLCKENRLGKDVNAIFLDFHGEATSEKMAMANFCDGKVSAVVGTHTHIPTADAHILENGTGYQTDAGMCGVYNSVIGMEKNIAVSKLVRQVPGERLRPATGVATICGTIIDINPDTGLCNRIEPLRMGGDLQEFLPEM